MKSLWRKIGFILAWSILILGTVGAIVGAATGRTFYLFCEIFVPALFFFAFLMVYLEHTNNVEMRLDQTYRKENGMNQLPENAYSNIPNFVATATQPAPAYQQPVQQQFQQPVQQPVQPVQYQQPAPAPAPVPQPVQQPTPAPQPVPTPVQQPAAEPQPWTCAKCGTLNNATANFCKGCGNKKG